MPSAFRQFSKFSECTSRWLDKHRRISGFRHSVYWRGRSQLRSARPKVKGYHSVVPRMHTQQFWQQKHDAGPRVWNALLTHRRQDMNYFKQSLKGHAFRLYRRPRRIVTVVFLSLRKLTTYLLTYLLPVHNSYTYCSMRTVDPRSMNHAWWFRGRRNATGDYRFFMQITAAAEQIQPGALGLITASAPGDAVSTLSQVSAPSFIRLKILRQLPSGPEGVPCRNCNDVTASTSGL